MKSTVMDSSGAVHIAIHRHPCRSVMCNFVRQVPGVSAHEANKDKEKKKNKKKKKDSDAFRMKYPAPRSGRNNKQTLNLLF